MRRSGLDPPGEHASYSDGSSLYFWKQLTDAEQCGTVTGQLWGQEVKVHSLLRQVILVSLNVRWRC